MPLHHHGNVTPAVFGESHTHLGEQDDGSGAFRVVDGDLTIRMEEVYPITYIAQAKAGTATNEAKWQCMKIDETSGLVITFADGDEHFNNLATNLSSLSYL